GHDPADDRTRAAEGPRRAGGAGVHAGARGPHRLRHEADGHPAPPAGRRRARLLVAAAAVESAMIRVENLVKKYGAFPAVDDVNLDVAPGEIHGFLGPNG